MMIETSHDDREAGSDNDDCWLWKWDLAALFKTMMMLPVVVIIVVVVVVMMIIVVMMIMVVVVIGPRRTFQDRQESHLLGCLLWR